MFLTNLKKEATSDIPEWIVTKMIPTIFKQKLETAEKYLRSGESPRTLPWSNYDLPEITSWKEDYGENPSYLDCLAGGPTQTKSPEENYLSQLSSQFSEMLDDITNFDNFSVTE